MSDLPGMTPERYKALNLDPTQKLTDTEKRAGWHFCGDWDGMLIHVNDEEAGACLCFPPDRDNK